MEIEKSVGESIGPAKRATALAFIHGDVSRTGCAGLSFVNWISVIVCSSAFAGAGTVGPAIAAAYRAAPLLTLYE